MIPTIGQCSTYTPSVRRPTHDSGRLSRSPSGRRVTQAIPASASSANGRHVATSSGYWTASGATA